MTKHYANVVKNRLISKSIAASVNSSYVLSNTLEAKSLVDSEKKVFFSVLRDNDSVPAIKCKN